MANSGFRQQNAEWHESFHPTKLRINKNRPTLIMMQGFTTKAVLPSNVDSYLYCYWCWLGDIRTITPFVQHREMFISSQPELQPWLLPQQCAVCVNIIFWLLAVKSISQWSCMTRKGWVEGGGSTEWHMQHMNILYKRTESSMSHTKDQIRHNEANLKLKTTVGFYWRGKSYFQTPTCLNKGLQLQHEGLHGPRTEVTLLHWVTGGYQNSQVLPHYGGTYSERRRWGSAVIQTPARNGS